LQVSFHVAEASGGDVIASVVAASTIVVGGFVLLFFDVLALKTSMALFVNNFHAVSSD
jgi:hypothetical protein